MKLQLTATALTLIICCGLRDSHLKALPTFVLFFFATGLYETLHTLLGFIAALGDETAGSEATHDRGAAESEFENFERGRSEP